MTGVPQDVKDRYLGAMKFHRALNHFNAVRVWGDIPLMKEPITDFAVANDVTRSPKADVYAFIAQDLEDAVKLLPIKWPDSATPDDGRPTRGAAGTMLAGLGHARIIPARTIITPRIPSAVPAVREATSSLFEIRRHRIVPVASIGKPHNVTSGARYIIDIPIGPDL